MSEYQRPVQKLNALALEQKKTLRPQLYPLFYSCSYTTPWTTFSFQSSRPLLQFPSCRAAATRDAYIKVGTGMSALVSPSIHHSALCTHTHHAAAAESRPPFGSNHIQAFVDACCCCRQRAQRWRPSLEDRPHQPNPPPGHYLNLVVRSTHTDMRRPIGLIDH
jgi:hypothetical protein